MDKANITTRSFSGKARGDGLASKDPAASTIERLPVLALVSLEMAARLGSFGAAGDVLGLAPSAIIHRIRGLEQRLGSPFFKRSGRSVTLSECGERLLRYVRQGFLAFEQGVSALQNSERANQIRVSALAPFTQTILIPNLGKFSSRWPDYDVCIEATPQFVDSIASMSQGDPCGVLRFCSSNC